MHPIDQLRDHLETRHEDAFHWAAAQCDFDKAAAANVLEKCYAEVMGPACAGTMPSTASLLSRLRQKSQRRRLLRSWRRPLLFDWDPWEVDPPNAAGEAKDFTSRGRYVRAVLGRLPRSQRDAVLLRHRHKLGDEAGRAVLGGDWSRQAEEACRGMEVPLEILGRDEAARTGDLRQWIQFASFGLEPPPFSLVWSRARERYQVRWFRRILLAVGCVFLLGAIGLLTSVALMPTPDRAAPVADQPKSVPAEAYYDRFGE